MTTLNQDRVLSRRATWFQRAGGAICFGLPLLLALDFEIVGRMFLSDFAVVLLLPFAWWDFRRIRPAREIRILLITGLIWLTSAVVTDLVRQTPPESYLRGWGEIALTLGAILIFYTAVVTDSHRARTLLWGVAAAAMVRTWLVPLDNAAEVPWRLGGITALALVCLLLLTAAPPTMQRALTIPSLLGLAVFALLQESRNNGGVLLAISLYAAWTGWFHLRGFTRPSRRHIVAGVVLAAVASLAILQLYAVLAESGSLGEPARNKYLVQKSSPVELLITGRADNIGSVLAIADSPLIGHGSRAPDPGYRAEAEYWLRRHGYSTELPDDPGIPTHSYFFGSWVQAGVGGPIFWVTSLSVILSALVTTATHRSVALRGLTAFLVLRLIWDTAFSPFGGLGRLYVPAYLVALIFIPFMADRFSAGRTVSSPTESRT